MRKRQKLFIGLFISVLLGIVFCVSGMVRNENEIPTISISAPEDLVALSREVNAGNSYEGVCVRLTNDIDMSEVDDFIPVGEWEGEHTFEGVFDGDGYTIRNLTILGDEEANLGLFGTLGGIICNLTMENCHVRGSACGVFCSIAAHGNAAIINCAVKDCCVEAAYTDIIGGQYLGIVENCIIDGQDNAEALNNNLASMWRKLRTVPTNLWEEGENGPVLSNKKVDFPKSIYMTIEGLKTDKIIALYQEEVEDYVFCLPAMGGKRKGTVVVEFWDGSRQTESVTLPRKDELIFEKNGDTYTVRFLENENTPAVFLETGVSGGFDFLRDYKENELSGIIRVLDERGELQYTGQAERIHGRGNDSWFQDKQGFGFKLKDDANILGMGRDKDYALLPGYRRASLLTYQVVWDLSKEVQWENALEGRMVQLYADGEYWGLYFLTEKIEAGTERIPIKETREINSGFVFEFAMSDYKENDICVKTSQGNNYVIVSPAETTEEQREYCLNYWNELESAVCSESGYNEVGRYYTEYLDLESWAAQWLFYEINGEYSVSNSVYYYRDAERTENAKVKALFPWDVEHSFAVFAEGGTAREGAEKTELWKAMGKHEEFRTEVRRQWEERFRPALEKLLEEDAVENTEGIGSLEYYVRHFEKAAELNELRWGEEQDMTRKAESIGEWMELTIPYLDINLYLDEFFVE